MAGSSQSSSDSDNQGSSPGFGMRSVLKTIKLKFPTVRNVPTQELGQWLASPEDRTVVLLDSRPDEEYIISHIEGAIRVDYETKNLEALVQTCEERFQDNPKPTIVCYCSIGYRSSAVAGKLQKYFQALKENQAIPEVYNLEGSLFKWANERRPMVDSQGQPTRFAHPYSSLWGKLLDKSLRKEKV